MNIWEIILLGGALAMDATAVAMTDGMCDCKVTFRKAILIALCFGFFQGLMPIFGFYSGRLFQEFISAIDQYIAFGILAFLGIRMIYESWKTPDIISALTPSKILLQGLATSIDALMVGVTLALVQVEIYRAASIIAIVTFLLSLLGVYIGRKCGSLVQNKAQILGGLILIGIGIRLLFA